MTNNETKGAAHNWCHTVTVSVKLLNEILVYHFKNTPVAIINSVHKLGSHD